MAAECWACAMGLRLVGVDAPYAEDERSPLGCCYECHVFGCSRHGQKDRVSGKWLCYPTIAAVLSVSAGLDDESTVVVTLRITSTVEFERRFPQLARSTVEERQRARLRIPITLERTPYRHLEVDLIADAIGLLDSLVSRDLLETGFEIGEVVPARLAAVYMGSRRG